MNESVYCIKPLTGALDWAQIPSAPIDNLQWSQPVSIAAWGQACYDAEALYVRLHAEEQNIRAEERDTLGMPCEDSCLEFFFCPEAGDLRYFNIEFNPNCCLYLGIGSGNADLTRLAPENAQELLCPKVLRDDKGWEVSYRIPFAFIRRFFPAFSPRPGKLMAGNFYKCGDLTPIPHFLSWNKIDSETPCFHLPTSFGTLQFT